MTTTLRYREVKSGERTRAVNPYNLAILSWSQSVSAAGFGCLVLEVSTEEVSPAICAMYYSVKLVHVMSERVSTI